MFAPLPTPHEMNGWDKASVAFGIRPELLMDAAAREALHVLRQEVGPLEGRQVLLVAGPGNNGGDAWALARHLDAEGALPQVLHTRPRGAYTGESGYHLRLAVRAGVPMTFWKAGRAELPLDADILVDGLLGTGLRGELQGEACELIELMNRFWPRESRFILALDIPSGLNGLSGRPSPVAVRASATVTFQAAKLGLTQPEAADFLGRLHVRSIGIPRQVREAAPPEHEAITPAIAELLSSPAADQHKGSAGHVLVVGGSPGLTGAPLLAALGALRSGSGLVSIACPADMAETVKANTPDVMLLPLGRPGDGPAWSPALAAALGSHLPRFEALAIGPGMGRTPVAAEFLRALLALPLPPAVWDADALFHLAADAALLQALRPQDVITPHPGEAARLLGQDTTAVQADRPAAARALAQRCVGAVVLKGAATLVAQADQPTAVSPYMEPNLAVGGSGDVLAGLIAALLARGLPARLAACLGVAWHGQAGRLLAQDFPFRGNSATDIALALPRAITILKGN